MPHIASPARPAASTTLRRAARRRPSRRRCARRGRPAARRSGWRRRAAPRARPRRPGRSRRPRISRPSASVLLTSTVVPPRSVSTSDGRMRGAAGHVLRHRHPGRRRRPPARARATATHGWPARPPRRPCRVFILSMRRGRLERQAAGVEGDALADQRDLAAAAAVGQVRPAAAGGPSPDRRRGCRRTPPSASACSSSTSTSSPAARGCSRARPRRARPGCRCDGGVLTRSRASSVGGGRPPRRGAARLGGRRRRRHDQRRPRRPASRTAAARPRSGTR